MVAKRGTKAVKRNKKVESLRVKAMTSRQAKGIKGGDFGVENPTSIGSSTGGAGAGKVKF